MSECTAVASLSKISEELKLLPLFNILGILYLTACQTGLIVEYSTKTMIVQAVFVYSAVIILYLGFLESIKEEIIKDCGLLSKLSLVRYRI